MVSFFDKDDIDIRALDALVSQSVKLPSHSQAIDIKHNIPVYDAPSLTDALMDEKSRLNLMSEWADILVNQSGVLVLKQAVSDHAAIDGATEVFYKIIEQEKEASSGGDHFAAAGANDRVWNSLQKLCLAAPSVFIRYFASLSIDAVCQAYLGPAYQMTTQVNLVHPGGRAQIGHRDYHLGFMAAEQAAKYPIHAHHISAGITLQGAIAHCDMPVISGPTKLLPFSHLLENGYLAIHNPASREYFEAHYVQMPLEKGDAIFFSPAIFHAAGDNGSVDISRMANLMQISSMMGRPIEAVDRVKMVKAILPVLQESHLSKAMRDAVINAAAEGYAFPTNLDKDPPFSNLGSETQAELLKRAIDEKFTCEEFEIALTGQTEKRNA